MKKITLVYYRVSDVKRVERTWNNPWSWLDINYWSVWKTGGEFCHVDIMLEGEFIYSVNGIVGYLDRVPSKGYSTPDRYKFQTIYVSEQSFDRISFWCEKKYNKRLRFDTFGLLCNGVHIPFLSTNKRMICSEFVVRALQQGGLLKDVLRPKTVSPSSLYEMLQTQNQVEMVTIPSSSSSKIEIRSVY